MNKLIITFKSRQGMILPTLLIVMLIVTVLALSIATLAVSQLDRTDRSIMTTNSLLAAEAGAEQTLHELNADSDFSGFSSEETFIDNATQGRATYQTTVENGSLSNEKILTSTGRVYFPSSDTTPTSVRKVRLVVVGTTTNDYSVQTGPGGLIMSNSATIANGDVHINGYLTMSNSARIGSASNPGRVYVAHINCPDPPDSTFPVQCTSGQPITLSNSAHIYGEVYATNQTNGNGMSNPGLITNSTAPEVTLPDYDRDAHKAAVTTTYTSSEASCWGSQTVNWPANLHVTGNVDLSNNCKVVVNGDVWIDGILTMSNSSKMEISDSLTERPVIMVDDKDGVRLSNGTAILTNSNGLGAEFITFYSEASCSPDCADVTGVDLANSQDVVTIQLSNSSLAAGSKFYARWSKINLSNGGSVGAVLGQTIRLSNSGNISFGTELSSGQTVWAIKNYQQVFD